MLLLYGLRLTKFVLNKTFFLKHSFILMYRWRRENLQLRHEEGGIDRHVLILDGRLRRELRQPGHRLSLLVAIPQNGLLHKVVCFETTRLADKKLV